MTGSARTLIVWAETRPDGSPFHEELLVEPGPDGAFVLLRSPAFAQGLAAGDSFMIDDQKRPVLLSRGGNVAIQVFDPAGVQWVRRFIESAMNDIGGTVDGEAKQVIVLSAPVEVGFDTIEAILQRLAAKSPSLKWYFGNVYDPSDGVTQLNWWSDIPRRPPRTRKS